MTGTAEPRTTIVTVVFNSAAVLPGMLASVPEGVPVIIVDNGSGDSSARIADAAGAQVIRLHRNEGFGRACNAGAALADTEFLLFLNPDAALGPGALDALEAAADANPLASAFNPHIRAPLGASGFKRRSVLLPRSAWLERGPREHGELKDIALSGDAGRGVAALRDHITKSFDGSAAAILPFPERHGSKSAG